MWADSGHLTKDYVIREDADTKRKIWLHRSSRLAEAGNPNGTLGESSGGI